jgi:uncharacterized Fe-S cluster-containing radical SAM superfamily enzyme
MDAQDQDHLTLTREHEYSRLIPGPPHWYDRKSKRCEHASERSNVVIVEVVGDGSDGGWVLMSCKVCGVEWSRFVEG